MLFILVEDTVDTRKTDDANKTIVSANETTIVTNKTSIFPQTHYYREPFKHIQSNSTTRQHNITIVTGASKNHFCALKSLLYRINKEIDGLDVRIVVYDLGITKSQKAELNRLLNLSYISELRIFNFSAYPSFWNIRKNRGEYAWKVGITAEVARDYLGTKLVWLDAGTFVKRKFFLQLPSLMKKFNGFVSPNSPGRMENWTHSGVYKYFGDDHSKYDQLKNCNAASVAFDTKERKELIDNWYICALNKDCIAPPGSSRKNHRQDQALLTYLAARKGLYCKKSRKVFGITTHMDRKCKKYNAKYEKQHGLIT
ncbi:12220_t:CDS:1 [Acaulospora morrowiae]|uniref:12220_t:CDS:1 n=1 Tax=Acaulospora morrowiae TaxID=94023 RepID=A0A9N9FVS4_9GLOM|nr:12220_t:CDS:1 [Acaulospora morrowiae]